MIVSFKFYIFVYAKIMNIKKIKNLPEKCCIIFKISADSPGSRNDSKNLRNASSIRRVSN